MQRYSGFRFPTARPLTSSTRFFCYSCVGHLHFMRFKVYIKYLNVPMILDRRHLCSPHCSNRKISALSEKHDFLECCERKLSTSENFPPLLYWSIAASQEQVDELFSHFFPTRAHPIRKFDFYTRCAKIDSPNAKSCFVPFEYYLKIGSNWVAPLQVFFNLLQVIFIFIN